MEASEESALGRKRGLTGPGQLELELELEYYTVTFQSRFGSAAWLQPYTEPTLQVLAKAGTRSVEVMYPSFVSDCLETLEEINVEAREAFLQAGGHTFEYIPCLSDSPAWIEALKGITEQHLAGWITAPGQ